MSIWSELSERLRALFSRTRENRDFDEELAFHIDMEAASHLRDGLSPEESRRQAHIAFGGAEKVREDVRDARGSALRGESHRSRDPSRSLHPILRRGAHSRLPPGPPGHPG